MSNDGMRIVNQRDGRVIAERAQVARSWGARLVGLIGRSDLPDGSAFVIPGCRQVHTFLMRFPIDVVFSDVQDRVISVVEHLKPWRATVYCRCAARAIELPAGTASASGVSRGDVLVIEGAD